MKCKKHGEGIAVVVNCKFCNTTSRYYKSEISKTFNCKNCGAPLSEEDITSKKETEKTCSYCGYPYCDDCLITVHGSYICESCSNEIIEKYEEEKAKKEHKEHIKKMEELQKKQVLSSKKSTEDVSPKKRSCLGCLLIIIFVAIITSLSIMIILLY